MTFAIAGQKMMWFSDNFQKDGMSSKVRPHFYNVRPNQMMVYSFLKGLVSNLSFVLWLCCNIYITDRHFNFDCKFGLASAGEAKVAVFFMQVSH